MPAALKLLKKCTCIYHVFICRVFELSDCFSLTILVSGCHVPITGNYRKNKQVVSSSWLFLEYQLSLIDIESTRVTNSHTHRFQAVMCNWWMRPTCYLYLNGNCLQLVLIARLANCWRLSGQDGQNWAEWMAGFGICSASHSREEEEQFIFI